MLLIYTGNGKGKTSACIGQVIRALGQGLNVAFAQFMKQDEKAGEQRILRKLLGDNFYVGGKGFFRKEELREIHREAALLTLNWAKNILSLSNILILDESLYALRANLLEDCEIINILELADKNNTHVVLSGRDAPKWLMQRADLVTNMQEIKHHMKKGSAAICGIEY